jgi:hypothetical protein
MKIYLPNKKDSNTPIEHWGRYYDGYNDAIDDISKILTVSGFTVVLADIDPDNIPDPWRKTLEWVKADTDRDFDYIREMADNQAIKELKRIVKLGEKINADRDPKAATS